MLAREKTSRDSAQVKQLHWWTRAETHQDSCPVVYNCKTQVSVRCRVRRRLEPACGLGAHCARAGPSPVERPPPGENEVRGEGDMLEHLGACNPRAAGVRRSSGAGSTDDAPA